MKSTPKLVVLATLATCLPLVVQAQVRASLVAADRSVQPGHPVPLALRLEHQPAWHTYWLNAGTGYPTRLKWGLPEGWTAGAIQWPVPILIEDSQGNVTGHGFRGVVYLPVTLNAPANAPAGGTITLSAQAKWLMCADVCIPGGQDVSLTLPVSAAAPQPNTDVRAQLARMPMPQASQGWRIAAERDGGTVALRAAAPVVLSSPHFFPAQEFIQYDKPQEATGERGEWRLTLPVAVDAGSVPGKLTGVLAYTDANGAYRGVSVDVPLATGSAIAAAHRSAAKGSVSSASSAPGLFAGSPKGGASSAGFSAGVLALAFFGGLILNLMPCVFPVLGIKIVGFVNEAGSERRKVTMHGVMFTLGVVLSFWALAGLLAVLRAGGQQLGWGFQLQSAPFVFALTVVMLVFALSLSGVFEFGVRATGVGGSLHTRTGYGGSFFTGVLATVVATPCSAPFLAPALGAALALPIGPSFAVFTAIGAGLSGPYLLLSIFPQAVHALPRPGRWMQTFKQAMAFPLYATVAYLVWVLAGQTSENGLLMVLLGLTLIAMGVWLYGRYSAPGASAGRVRFAYAGGLALLAFGLIMGWPRAARSTDIVWEPWSAQRVQQLQDEGRPVYVDFTARWCATCQANKKVVFSSNSVRDYLREHNVATLKADWTNSDPRITAELAKWNRSAVPFNLVYLPGLREPKVLPEILTPSIVLDALK